MQIQNHTDTNTLTKPSPPAAVQKIANNEIVLQTNLLVNQRSPSVAIIDHQRALENQLSGYLLRSLVIIITIFFLCLQHHLIIIQVLIRGGTIGSKYEQVCTSSRYVLFNVIIIIVIITIRKFKNSNGWQKLWVVFTNFCLYFYKTFQGSSQDISIDVTFREALQNSNGINPTLPNKRTQKV